MIKFYLKILVLQIKLDITTPNNLTRLILLNCLIGFILTDFIKFYLIVPEQKKLIKAYIIWPFSHGRERVKETKKGLKAVRTAERLQAHRYARC